MKNEINWIESDGGPHILIERKFLKIWKGESDRAFQESMRYYEQAGLIDDYIGELKIGLGKCIIISEDVPASTWITKRDTNGTIVVANYIGEGITYDILSTEINNIPDCKYKDTGLVYDVLDRELYLFPACDLCVDWTYKYCKMNLLPGRYKIRLIEEYIFHDSSFRLFNFKADKGDTLNRERSLEWSQY